jgi:DASS family divalent anion:Na+ symporter
VLPFAKELSTVAGSSPDDGTEDRFGKFLHLTLFHMAQIGSGFFLISVPSNIVSHNCATNLIRAKVDLDFGSWVLGSFVPCLISLTIVPIMCYLIWKPKLTSFPDAKGFSKAGLEKLGPMSSHEYWVCGALGITITLWILATPLENIFKISSVAAGLLGLMILLSKGVEEESKFIQNNYRCKH